ncbi:MAG: hypothetical protein ACREID_00265 [Planctomycetota bacterium]
MQRIAALLAVLAASAWAGEKVTLVFRDGKTLVAEPAACDAEGVTVGTGPVARTIPWKELTPASAYATRKALTDSADGPARLELSAFALSLGLHPEALADLEVALALGAISEADFEAREEAIEKEEIEALRGRVDALLETGDDPKACLDAIRRLKERYPDHPANADYQPQVDALVEALRKEADEQVDAKEAAQDDARLAALRKALDSLAGKKNAALAKAEALKKAGVEAAAKGQVARARRNLVEPTGAERQYKLARALIRDMVRKDRSFAVIAKTAIQKEYDAIERSLVDCYLHVARMLMRERNYKGAVEYVRKILLYDPIHEEALEMAEEIKKNRIHFKASDVTNARPRVTGG